MRLLIVVHVNAQPSTYTIRFSNLVASTPDGKPVSLTAKPIRIGVKKKGTAAELLQPSGVLNAASMLPGPIAPGEIVCLLGHGTAMIPDELATGNPTVLMNGVPAPILYQGSHQVTRLSPLAWNRGKQRSSKFWR
jgi:hypothetical protein